MPVPFDWDLTHLSRRPFLGQIVDFDLLLCTGFDSEHADLFLCAIFTNRHEWSNDWAKRWTRLWLVTSPRKLHQNFISRENKFVVTARNLQSMKTFLTLELSQHPESGSTFSSSQPVAAAETATESRTPGFCACSPPANGHGFCRQNLRLSSGIAFVSDHRIARWPAGAFFKFESGRGSNLGSNLGTAAWPTSCKGFICSEIPE